MEFLWSAFILGIISNVHCLAMCGPLAFSLPIHQASTSAQLMYAAWYNLARILMYVLLGVLAASMGNSIFSANFQSTVSIVAGILLIASVFVPNLARRLQSTMNVQFFNRGLGKLYTQLMQKPKLINLGIIGAINGLLPCGMVYIALVGALLSGGALNGGLYMLSFGLGTLPVMMASPVLGSRIRKMIGTKWNFLIPIYIFLFGVLLILRGANLGIPYVSPEIVKDGDKTELHCHPAENEN